MAEHKVIKINKWNQNDLKNTLDDAIINVISFNNKYYVTFF